MNIEIDVGQDKRSVDELAVDEIAEKGFCQTHSEVSTERWFMGIVEKSFNG